MDNETAKKLTERVFKKLKVEEQEKSGNAHVASIYRLAIQAAVETISEYEAMKHS